MAKGKKTGGRDFTGIPGPGRPPNPPELNAIKQMTKGELELLFHKVLNAKPEELNNFNGTVLEKWLASIIYQGIKSGDYGRLNPFLERLFGKVKDEMAGDMNISVIIKDYTAKE